MAKPKEYTFRNGLTVGIRPLSPLQLQDIQMVGKPVRPKIPVERFAVRGGFQERPNPDNEAYQAALADFKLQEQDYDITNNYELLQFVFLMGVVDDPPPEYVETIQDFVPDPKRQKYQWIASQMPETDEISRLIQVITGQNMATEEGVEESTENFPSDGEAGGGTDAAAELRDEEEEADGERGDAAGAGGDPGSADAGDTD